MTTLWLDFETRSKCDLPAQGAYNYARDLSTEVLCMAYAFDDSDVTVWTPDQRFPQSVINHKGQIRAHNATFERLILWYVINSDHRLEQFYCTAAQSRANCAPGGLEDAGRFAGASMRKDHRGKQLIRSLCIPKPDGSFDNNKALLKEMAEYCAQDVRTMRVISQSMRDISAEELHDYHVNERVNDRGVKVDVSLCAAATYYSDIETADIQALVVQLTDGKITSVRSSKMRAWVRDNVGPEALKLMQRYKDGELTYTIDKSARASLLNMAESAPDQIPAHVADVIQCADDLWASSVAKFKRLSSLADIEDARVRGALVFAGGAATGRFSSYGAQVHNFGRKCAKNPDKVQSDMIGHQALVPAHGKRITDVLKGMLRPSLIADEGRVLVSADWSAIEARVTPWVSGRAQDKLMLFETGADIYKHNAMSTFNVALSDVDDQMRQIGKVQELALGFAGGIGAFASMGRNYGLHVSENDARRMVNAWRVANPWAVFYWSELERAYTSAMRRPKQEFSAGRTTYMYDQTHLWYILPSGRVLCYPHARLERGEITYAKAAWKPAAEAKEWPRARLWKGIACENITQAIAADLLRYALRQLDAAGLDVVLHVHDEIVIETTSPSAVVDTLTGIMTQPPGWAKGLPLAIGKPVIGTRYGKA